MSNSTVLIFGDICPDNNYRTLFDENPFGPFSEKIVADIRNASVTLANLECPATENKVAIKKCGPNLRAETKDIFQLKKIGFNILSLANNHILDYGEEGVIDTLQNCVSAKIQSVGAGINSKSAMKPLIYKIGEQKLGIISFAEAEFNLATESSPGANHFDVYDSYDVINELKRNSDYVLVLYHGGIEHYKFPSPLLQKKCRKMVSVGADLVLCQHSHCIGTFEQYKEGTILYGQGNAVFGYRNGEKEWNEGLVVKIDLKEPKNLEFKLLKAQPDGVHYAFDEEQKARIQQMKEDSKVLNNSEWISSSWEKYALKQEALDFPMLYGRSRVINKLNRMMNNLVIKMLYPKEKQMVTMNLLRCEAHHEVIQTIFEHNVLKK